MQEFVVNKKRRKEIIQWRCRNAKGAFRIGLIICNLFQIAVILGILAVVTLPVYSIYSDASFEIMIEVLMLLAVSIVWVISYGIQRIILGHYAAPWASFRREKLFLMGNEIEQSAFEWGYSNSYFSFSIKYSNIRQMEYSESEKILKIYGIMTAKEWDGPDRRRCIDKTTTESKDANETYLTLINYFDEFENLMKELEIRSGIPVKRVA